MLERIERVAEYHRSTQLTPQSVRVNPTVLDPSTKPSPFVSLSHLPCVSLPTELLDATTPSIPLLSRGLEAVDSALLHPVQDLKTLASWLFLANGLASKSNPNPALQRSRTCPSSGALYPCEIYVGAFGINGLEPGLYHYNAHDHSLAKMRKGAQTLATIKRGRPELNFLKSAPAVLLVSTIFWRSAWRYRQRGYRLAVLDAGHVVQNLVAAANGLGISTNPRLQVQDKTMSELIGVSPGADFGLAERVQAMVAWVDVATNPLPEPSAVEKRSQLPRIKRDPLSSQYVPYGSIIATHEDCVAPGVALRDIRRPSTELCPIDDALLQAAPPYLVDLPPGPPIRQTLLSRRSTRTFSDRSISRDQFLAINRLAYRGGSIFPMMPDGPHIAFLRPFWITNLVAGLDTGVCYYDPKSDKLAMMSRGDFRSNAAYLCVEQPICGEASAVCFLAADLRALATAAGPDTYRLAHLEAGVAGQRVYLAATALGLGCCGIGAFYDQEVRAFLGLSTTTWEPVYALAVGFPDTK